MSGRYRTATGLDDLIAAVSSGSYQPSTGTVGAKLLHIHECACHGRRSLAAFAKAGLRSEGLWWVAVLEADPDTLSDAEANYVAASFRVWIDGRRPFRIGAPDVL